MPLLRVAGLGQQIRFTAYVLMLHETSDFTDRFSDNIQVEMAGILNGCDLFLLCGTCVPMQSLVYSYAVPDQFLCST